MDNKYSQYSKEELIQKIIDLEQEKAALDLRLVEQIIAVPNNKDEIHNEPRLLHDPKAAYELLVRTTDSLFLFQKDGVCVDTLIKTNHSFLDEKRIIGKNIFDILPPETTELFKLEFDKVVKTGIISNQNYDLPVKKRMHYFKCIIQSYKDEFILCQYRDITERSQMKKRLETTNRKLKETQQVAKIGHWKYNSNTKMTYYSGFGNVLRAIEEETLVPIKKYAKYVHPDDKEAFSAYLSKDHYTNKSLDYRRILKNEDGNLQTFFLRTQITKIYQEKGERIVEGYVQNVDDMMKKRWEFEMVNAINNAVNDDIFGAYIDSGQLVFANQQFRMHNGIDPEKDISEYSILDLVDIGKEYWNEIVDMLRTKNNYKYSIKHEDANTGEELYFEGMSYIVKDIFGDEFIWSYWMNITKQTQAENDTKYTRELMNKVLDNIPISVFMKNPDDDFRYIYRNKISSQYHMISDIDTMNKSDFDIYPLELAERFRKEDQKVYESKKTHRYTEEYIDGDGYTRTIDILKLLLKSDTNNSSLIIGLGWDITDMKEIEKELLSDKLKAEQSDMLKSAFLSNMSHEIRTPLNAILGFSRIIAETDDQEERNHYYKFVESNNTRLLSLVNEILDFSKIESGMVDFSLNAFNLGELCQELYETYVLIGREEVKLIYENEGADLWVISDRNRVHQVLSNLIINAQKFTPKGSITYGFEVKNDQVEIHVTDTGIGISEDKVVHIFDRFMQIDYTAPGAGLGLAICQSIIMRLGGEISVNSVPGAGSTFRFTLPYKVVSEGQSQDVIVGSTIDNYNNKDIVILVAEDDDNSFKLINVMIGKKYTLVHAVDGMETIELFEKTNPDLILMDINMPGLNGFEVTKIIRQVSPDIPIIAISAHAYNADKLNAKEAGCNDFLSKPVSQDRLIETMQKYIKVEIDG